MDIAVYIQDFIPMTDSFEKIYELFRGIGYPKDKVFDPSYKRKIDEFDLVEFLYNSGTTENANKICNLYGSRGPEFLRDIFEKYSNIT